MPLSHAHGRRPGFLSLCLAFACGDTDPTVTTDGQTSVTGATTATTSTATAGVTTTATTGGDDGTTTGLPPQTTTSADDTGPATQTTPPLDTGDLTTAGPTGDPDTTAGDDDSSTGAPSEYFMMSDPLIGGTMGTAVGGSFGDNGWTITETADRLYWAVPRLTEGSVEFTVSNITLGNLPLNDHEIFAMYEGGYDIEHPIGYSPEFRNNSFKSMIRIYGTAEVGREGQQKIMWGLCPFGSPGYHDGTCPCTDPPGFFEEPFGGDGNWDGTPQRLRVEWKDGFTHYSRNGGEPILTIDWSATGHTFGPEDLYISLGNPRPLEVGTAGMPIGAVFSDLVVEGWTGPPSATCG